MATWQHLRSSTANKRPTTSLADGRIAINTNTASPGLFFKNSAGTGIVKVGPVHVGTTAPNSVPASGGSSGNYTGEQWLDTSVSPAQMKVWNGSTWVGIVADELPVSKLQDGAPRQLIQTDAAGTGVEWTSNVDVPGTLDVTSTATFDSIASHPLGTAGAPTITFTGDTNTGIYSPGADQLAISSNAVQRVNFGTNEVVFNDGGENCDFRIESDTNANIFFVDASANAVGIGTISPDANLEISTTLASETELQRLRVEGNTNNPMLRFFVSESNKLLTIGTSGSVSGHELSFRIGSLEAGRFDTAGRLLVGTSTAYAGVSGADVYQFQSVTSAAAGGLFKNTANSSIPTVLCLGKARSTSYGVVSSNDSIGVLQFQGADGTNLLRAAEIRAQVDGTPGVNTMPGRLVFSTTSTTPGASPTERMRIDSSGRLGLGNSAPLASLDVSGDIYGTLGIHFGNASGGTFFKSGTVENLSNSSRSLRIGADPGNVGANSVIRFDVDGSEAARIDSSGRVGIGTTSPDVKIEVVENSTGSVEIARFRIEGQTNNPMLRIFADEANNTVTLDTSGSTSGTELVFKEGGSEAARIDSSGRLLVGTSTAFGAAASELLQVANANGGKISLLRNDTSIASGNEVGVITWYSADGNTQPVASIACFADGDHATDDKPGRLVFATTADGASSPTERMRISNKGNTTITSVADNDAALRVDSNGTSGTQYGIYIETGNDQNDATRTFIGCVGGTTTRAQIRSNGGIANYSANDVNLSDLNVKKNIAPAADTWSCLKDWEIVNFHYKDQPDDADLNMGVIAQQVAESCPEVVTVFQEAKEATETEPAQEERIGVKEQQMMWMAIKALQEAQLRIETLEAEVAALKAS